MVKNMDSLKTNFNSLLEALKMQACDKVILINENGITDSNFVLTHIMKQIFSEEENGLCLVILHNTIGHYQNVGKLLEYDFLKKVEAGCAVVVEPLKSVWQEDDASKRKPSLNFFVEHKEQICTNLFLDIRNKLDHLLRCKSGSIYLVIDDLSHLLDMAIDIKHVVSFINWCNNLNERVSIIMSTHISGQADGILSNSFTYIADVIIDIDSLKTGRSLDVTGIITIKRSKANNEDVKVAVYHYKTLHREIRIFRPGDSVKYLLG